jgi:CheY-like chemotaxis protein
VIGEAVNGNNAVEIYRALSPDIVMLDTFSRTATGWIALNKIMENERRRRRRLLTVVGKPDIVLSRRSTPARGAF